jgi:hypothetical protein
MDRECADAVAAGNRKKKSVPGVVEVALMRWGVTFLSRYSQSAIRSRAQGRGITHELSQRLELPSKGGNGRCGGYRFVGRSASSESFAKRSGMA